MLRAFLLLNQRYFVATLTLGFSSWQYKKSTEPMLRAFLLLNQDSNPDRQNQNL